tara:strand:- start:235 stop:489 length:255 start_codon:yes stop_codon:yes gene_type:complete
MGKKIKKGEKLEGKQAYLGFTATNDPIDIAIKSSGNRKIRLLKVLSVPVALVILIPVVILQSCIWICKGDRTPGDVIQSYLDWL